MTTDKLVLEFTGKNVKPFMMWLKKFSSIDKSLLLEIDVKESEKFIAKTHNEERSLVKMSSIKYNDSGLSLKSAKPSISSRVKVGIFNISHLIKILEQFNDDEFSFVIEFKELLSGNNESEYAAEKLIFKNKTLKFVVQCSSLNIFKYISDDLFNNQISAVDPLETFELTKESISKIGMLNGLDDDDDEKSMTFKIDNKQITVGGKTYELFISKIDGKESFSLSIFKEQFSSIDFENYNVKFGEDRIVFSSLESDTCVVISKIEKDK